MPLTVIQLKAANPRLAIALDGDTGTRKALLERAGASTFITADDLVAKPLVSHLPDPLATVS